MWSLDILLCEMDPCEGRVAGYNGIFVFALLTTSTKEGNNIYTHRFTSHSVGTTCNMICCNNVLALNLIITITFSGMKLFVMC